MVVLLPELFSTSTEINSSSKTKSFCWCRVYRSTAQPTRSNAEKAHGIVIKEIAVLISTFGTDDSAMEHGIDVIRTAFECAYLQSPVNQRLQHSAGDSGLPQPLLVPARSILGIVVFNIRTSCYQEID